MLSFAKAIYDNEAETSDELSFERNDVIAVLEKDFNGLDGWWFCSLRGKTGIAPANRLQIIHEIKKKPTFRKAGKGFPGKMVASGVQGHTDYDLPRPNVPRKLGGSCEDLLSIEFVNYQGSGRDHMSVPNENFSIGRLDMGGTGGLGHRLGGSCENVLDLSTENLTLSNASSGVDVDRVYDVPVSLSPADFEQTGSSFRRKLDRGFEVSGRKQEDPGFDTGCSQRRTSNDAKVKSGSSGFHPSAKVSVNQAKTVIQSVDRDSALDDYDSPRAFTSLTPGKKSLNHNSGVKQVVNPSANTAAPKATSSNEKQPPVTCNQSFLDNIREVQNAVDQVISYSDRWAKCKTLETRNSIVRQICLSIWNKLQALLADFSKILVKVKGPTPLKDRFGALQVSASDLEEILNNMSRRRPNEVTLDFVKELSIIAQDIRTHVDDCASVLRGYTGDPNTAPSGVQPQNISPAPQPRGRVLPALTTRPKIVIEKCDSETGDYFPKASAKTVAEVSSPFKINNTKPQRLVRSASHGQAQSDYDVPKCTGTEEGGRPDRGSTEIRRSDRSPSDASRTKRSAAVFGDQRESFNILERKDLRSPVAPSKLIVAGKRSPNIAQASSSSSSSSASASHRLNSSGAVDYDIPLSTATAEVTYKKMPTFGKPASGDVTIVPLSVGDRRTMKFYGEQVVAVVRRLDDTCRKIREALNSDSSRQVASDHSAKFEILTIEIRKLIFICDSMARNIANAAVKTVLREHSSALDDVTKSTYHWLQSAFGTQWKTQGRCVILQRIDEMMKTALGFADYLSSKSGAK